MTTAAPQSATTVAAIKSELQQMVCTLHTADTYQEALTIWQKENGSLTESEISQVMGIVEPAVDPFQ